MFRETVVEPARLAFHHAAGDLDARRQQPLQSPAPDRRVRILGRDNHASHPRLDQGVRARPRAPGVTARFKCHVDGCSTSCFPSSLQRDNFRVILLVIFVAPNSDHDSVLHQDAPHGGVRRSQTHGMLRQFQRSLHPSFIRRQNFRLLRHNTLSTAEWQLVLQQRVHKRRAVEGQQIFERFSNAHETHGQLHLARDSDGNAALGRAIQLGQHDASHAG